MNKLGVLAFTLLLFFSTMLWYLANGSFNEYLKSQVELQGQYYSGLATSLEKANYSVETGQTTIAHLSLANLTDYQAKNALIIDEVNIEISAKKSHPLLTVIKAMSLNKLIINIEHKTAKQSNIEHLIENIMLTLANDYPQSYPNISAKLYAQKNPELNVDEYAKKTAYTGEIVEHTKTKNLRGRPQQKIIVSTINIKTLELNYFNGENIETVIKENIQISALGGKEGLLLNQIGGEILLLLFKLAEND